MTDKRRARARRRKQARRKRQRVALRLRVEALGGLRRLWSWQRRGHSIRRLLKALERVARREQEREDLGGGFARRTVHQLRMDAENRRQQISASG